ncbi:MAG: AraC family transcriptional regulator [Defluviitaleaceae bacterium]|nr:AraC family transcriptional regulator [Defluviitaleaceae bacterium]
MNWIQSLNRAISYMENHLTQDIGVSDVANKVYASSANFQRVFHLATGITIGDYIRNRRLSLAGQELLQPKVKIMDVAMKYQYDTQESFSKAFSRFHSISPSDVRKHLSMLKYFHPLVINITIQGGFNMSNSLEILVSAQHTAMQSDSIADLFAGVEPTRKHNKIRNYRRIENWQNYFLCSAIHSVGEIMGADVKDFKFYANFTGDNFTYLYAAEKGNPHNLFCDSGVTASFFMPHVVKKAYATFGYDCIYISNSQIKKEFRAVMNAIKASVDKGIPVLAWGMGNVTMGDGSRYDPLPEGCLIGGYGENDVLYVNLYPGEECMPTGSMDQYGYSTITNGLDTTNGLFFVGAKIKNPDMRKLYQDAINTIPTFLTLPVLECTEGKAHAFGKAAFDIWADTLVAEEYFTTQDDEGLGEIWWNLHGAPYCCVCTSAACDFIKDVEEKFPDITIAAKLLPLYKRMDEYRDEIWQLQGDFFVPMDKFRRPDFRAQIAEILRKMGAVCTDILKVFEG